MPFKGENPLGTEGGLDLYNTPQFPRVYAVAEGPMYILIMRLNGDLYERNRENVEDVIRVIGLRGENLAGFIVRHSGGVVESSATDLDFDQGFTVGQIAPGVVVISVGSGAIVTAMLAPDAVQNAQLADNAVQRENIVDGEIIGSKFAAGAVDTAALGALAVTLAKMAPNSVDASKLVAGAVTTAALNAGAVDTAALGALAVTLAKMAPNSVDSSKIVDDTILNADINSAAGIQFSKLESLPGLVRTGAANFTAQASISLNNCFSNKYTNYRLVLKAAPSVNSAYVYLRFRASGVDNTSALYRRNSHLASSAGTHVASANASLTADRFYLLSAGTASKNGICVMDIGAPNLAETTVVTNQESFYDGGAYMDVLNTCGLFDNTSVFDGITIFTSSGTISGRVEVYGYN